MLIDPYNSNLPTDAKRLLDSEGSTRQSQLVAMGSSGDNLLERPLDHQHVIMHSFSQSEQANVGFLAQLFASNAENAEVGVVQEAKHYRVETTEEGRKVEFGVAVRLAVASSSFNFEANLSIPNLTAAAQLGMTNTRVGIYVVGYTGPLGDLMPAPDNLNVDNFSSYMEAFENIQARVFDPDTAKYRVPTIIQI